MKLTVNGTPYEHRGSGAIAALLAEMGAEAKHVALLVNDRIVVSLERDAIVLKNGDTVEVLTFAGGG